MITEKKIHTIFTRIETVRMNITRKCASNTSGKGFIRLSTILDTIYELPNKTAVCTKTSEYSTSTYRSTSKKLCSDLKRN